MQLRIVSLTVSLLAMQAYAMQQEIIEYCPIVESFSNADTRGCIVEQLRLQNKIKDFGQSIRVLSCVNKDFWTYFADENFRKQVVLQMQGQSELLRKDTIFLLSELQFIAMKSKLQELWAWDKQKEFSQEQLEDAFYLNALDGYASLLGIASVYDNIVVMSQLLGTKKLNRNDSCLYDVAMRQIRSYRWATEDATKELILQKIQLLLDYMKVADYRAKLSEETLLMEAAELGGDVVAKLLLFKGANPYLCQIIGLDTYKGEMLPAILSASKQEISDVLTAGMKLCDDKKYVLKDLRSEKAQEAFSIDMTSAISRMELMENMAFKKEMENRMSMIIKRLKDAFDFADDCKTKEAGWFKTLVDSVTEEKKAEAEEAEKEVGDVVKLLLSVKF